MTKSDLKNRIDNLSPAAKKLFLSKLAHSMVKETDRNIDSGSKRLIAYVEGNGSFDKPKFRTYLQKKLPDYMVPSAIVSLDKMPTLPNGKVDRKALSAFSANADLKVPKKKAESSNDLEKSLIQIWEDVLGFSPIIVNDNFFEIGGDSILSIQIIARARKLGIMISPNQLFENQTISALAQNISENVNQEDQWDFLVSLRKQGTKKPLFCVHSGGGHVFFYNLLTEYMKPERPIYALQPSGLDGKGNMHQSIEEMTADYLEAMRTVQPEGPYNLLVYCFSATIGNEMAIQLEKLGQEINIIVMDTMASPWTLKSPKRMKARAKSFFIRFFKNPLESIKVFFIDRFWRISPMWIKLFGDENQKKLEKVKINLRKVCLAYEWKNHSGNVSLILTKKPHESLQEVTIDSWKELTSGDVKLFFTKGNHRTLFEEPDVRFVSEKIDDCMVE